MTLSRLRRCAAAAVLALALAGCSGAGGGSDTPTDTAVDAPSAQDAMPTPADEQGDDPATPATPGTGGDGGGQANEDALTFTGVDLDGDPVDARVHAGGDVVLWMWAPW